MRLLEYQSKKILQDYHFSVPKGQLVFSRHDPINIDTPMMIKAQVPIGGRGKCGGVLAAFAHEEAQQHIASLFESEIKGYRPSSLLVEEQVTVMKEFFLAITYDTVVKRPVFIFSSHGGINIEKNASSEPEKVVKYHFPVSQGLQSFQAREFLADYGISGQLLLKLGASCSSLARLFLDYDATIAEINPLALTDDDRLVALDCHIDIEDDAIFRQKKVLQISGVTHNQDYARKQTEFEKEASKIDSMDHRGVAGRVIEFDGDLGLIIGGGGASLTAFDAIRAHGGNPANYCEIGGNPSVMKVAELTKLLISKPNVKKIAVIMNVVSNTRVDLVARGVINGILEMGKKPAEVITVFRVPGAWEEEGFKILNKYGVFYCDRSVSIDAAAKIAVNF